MRRAGGQYYPKLQCAAPFTPVTGRRMFAVDEAVERALIAAGLEAVKVLRASSLHVTFPTEDEWRSLGDAGFLQRTGVQFHWTNAGYVTFDDFLKALADLRRRRRIAFCHRPRVAQDQERGIDLALLAFVDNGLDDVPGIPLHLIIVAAVADDVDERDQDTPRRHCTGKRRCSGRTQRRKRKKRRLRREGEPWTGRREEGRRDERDGATDGREDGPSGVGEADYERAMERPHDNRRWDQ
jgi:hypothetical protein